MSFLNRPVVATMAVHPLPQPAHPPFTEALKPLKHISIWMERPPRAARGGRGATLLGIVRLVLIRAL